MTWSRQQRHKARAAKVVAERPRPGVTSTSSRYETIVAPGRTVCARCFAPIENERQMREHVCRPVGDPQDLLR